MVGSDIDTASFLKNNNWSLKVPSRETSKYFLGGGGAMKTDNPLRNCVLLSKLNILIAIVFIVQHVTENRGGL